MCERVCVYSKADEADQIFARCEALGVGGLYITLGAATYLVAALRLRRELMITPLGYLWYAFSAAWPTTMYIAGMRCLCDDHPKLLITSLSAGPLVSYCVHSIGNLPPPPPPIPPHPPHPPHPPT